MLSLLCISVPKCSVASDTTLCLLLDTMYLEVGHGEMTFAVSSHPNGKHPIAVPIAAGLFFPAVQVRLPPELAALAMALSSVSVLVSSLLLKGYQPPVLEDIGSSYPASRGQCLRFVAVTAFTHQR